MRLRQSIVFLFVAALVASPGCSVSDLDTAQRRERGLVIILPGMEGRSTWNIDLARGLDEGGVDYAIEIYDWGIPAGMLLNLADLERNKRIAGELADHLNAYRSAHPHRPIHVFGHSAGGGVAVLATEMLPEGKKISSVVLLAAALHPDYDLSKALSHTEWGIFNYYSKLDVGFLAVGTTVAGNVDRRHGPAAGAVGFNVPSGESRRGYLRLHQIEWKPPMRWYGHMGDHMGWTRRPFAKRYLAPLINSLGADPDNGYASSVAKSSLKSDHP